VRSVSIELVRTDRARWLAELSGALAEAQQLLFDLELSLVRPEASELYQTIEAARLEVRPLQISRTASRGEEDDPKWTEIAPWHITAHEGC
jgi:hypothetical protein